MTANSFPPVVLHNGVDIEGPLGVVLGFLKARWRFDVSDPSRPGSFGEPDLRLANRAGARIPAVQIPAVQIAAILERRRAIEQALQAIAPDAPLAGAADSAPWLPLRQLFDAFADIKGVGLSKMTKALYPKRPALIPLLDSIVQKYLQDDDLGAQAPFGAAGPNVTFTVTAGSLPPGLNLSPPSGTSAAITGSPTQAGTFTSPSRRPTAA